MIDARTKRLLIISIISGALAVIIGAFGAHTIKALIPADSLTSYKTGVSYQFSHTFASIITLLLFLKFQVKQFRWASVCFLIGILLFSGSIYLLTTDNITGIGMKSILGPMTPIGGLFFIIGWLMLLMATIKLKSEN